MFLGMVAACAGCNISQPWGTTVIGIGAGLLYMAFSSLALILKIDDPLDAFAVHFGGGLWGLIAVCLIGEKGIFYAIFYHDVLFTQALAVFFSIFYFNNFLDLATWVEPLMCIGHNMLVCSSDLSNVFLVKSVQTVESITGG